MNNEIQKLSRQQQKHNTRHSIKAVAKEAFLKHGIETTNTREISAKCGVAVGTFFSHFPDKMALVKEIFFEEMDLNLTASLNHLLAETDATPCEFIDEFALELFGFYLEHRQYALLILGEGVFDKGFFHTQLQGIKENIKHRFQKIEVDEESALIFAENMSANFQYVLLDMLASTSINKTPWLRRLQQLNLPFAHIYQNANKRLNNGSET